MAVKINHDSFPENFLNVLKVDPKSKMSSTKQEGVHRHDATWKLPVVDHLASATERKVQDLARPLVRARSETSQNRPPLVALGLATARGGLALSESPARAAPARALQTGYAPGTRREKLYGKGRARLDADHRRSGSAVLPIGRAVDEQVGRGRATPRSGLDVIPRSWREISYLSSSPKGDRGFEACSLQRRVACEPE